MTLAKGLSVLVVEGHGFQPCLRYGVVSYSGNGNLCNIEPRFYAGSQRIFVAKVGDS